MIDNKWDAIIDRLSKDDYFIKLMKFVDDEYNSKVIYPKKENIYKAFELTSFDNVKVVILGQDPYHNVNQAHGLSFSVPVGEDIPPSLRNIFKEIKEDLNIEVQTHGNLEKWAHEGVLLLNAILTVEAHKPLSHSNMGWEKFTENIIKELNDDDKPKVFLLWGNYAKNKSKLITNKNHLVLMANHPSPLSAYRGFFGCKHFSQTNDFLIKNNREPIRW